MSPLISLRNSSADFLESGVSTGEEPIKYEDGFDILIRSFKWIIGKNVYNASAAAATATATAVCIEFTEVKRMLPL